MDIATLVFVLFGLITGLYAAFWWLRASCVQVDPEWTITGEPVDRVASNQDWIVAAMESMSKSADLNRRAALWTAASVMLNAIAATIGVSSGLIH